MATYDGCCGEGMGCTIQQTSDPWRCSTRHDFVHVPRYVVHLAESNAQAFIERASGVAMAIEDVSALAISLQERAGPK